MLVLNIAPVIKARGIEKPFSYLVKAGFSRHAAHLLLNSTPRTFRLDHIEHLCKLLVCEPNDLLFWKPNSGETIPNNHPLFKLNQINNNASWKETLSNIPFSQLKEITSQINSGNSQ